MGRGDMEQIMVKMTNRKRKTTGNRCEASGYRLVGRDFYTVSQKDGKVVCDCCGKVIKLSVRNGNEYIPTHNASAAT